MEIAVLLWPTPVCGHCIEKGVPENSFLLANFPAAHVGATTQAQDTALPFGNGPKGNTFVWMRNDFSYEIVRGKSDVVDLLEKHLSEAVGLGMATTAAFKGTSMEIERLGSERKAHMHADIAVNRWTLLQYTPIP